MPAIDLDAICAERKLDKAKISFLIAAARLHRQQMELHIRLLENHLGADVDDLDMDDETLLSCNPDDVIERLAITSSPASPDTLEEAGCDE
jgi:hypothetical protein